MSAKPDRITEIDRELCDLESRMASYTTPDKYHLLIEANQLHTALITQRKIMVNRLRIVFSDEI